MIFIPHLLFRLLPAAAICAAAAGLPSSALAGETAGGATFERPAVTGLECGDGQQAACPRGQVLRLEGTALDSTRTVRFLGKRGRRDDRSARPLQRTATKVLVRVPLGARSGALKLVTSTDPVTTPALTVLPQSEDTSAEPTTPVSDLPGVFPIKGDYEFGKGAAAFGGGRGHQGWDVFAKCGTPLVSAFAGTVHRNAFQSRAGNYIVIDAADGTSQAYMHLADRSPLKKGDEVAAGDPIGEVGATGRASGCHLHFELWTAPGWYRGGSAIDPLPTLKRLAGAKAARAR